MGKYMIGRRDLHLDHPDWDDGLFVEVEIRYVEWSASYDEPAGWEIESIETVDSGSLVNRGTDTWHKVEANFVPESGDQSDEEDWV